MKFILGKKIGMTTIYDEQKGALNVTLIECEPNIVNCVRNMEKDGYTAVQIKTKKTCNKSLCREMRVSDVQIKKDDKISLDVFEIGDIVNIRGITKGKGFQGVMKRHGFHGSPASHGHRHDHRAPGSIGSAFPEHVIKGKKMAGRMGTNKLTVKNLEVVFIDKENNLLAVKGAIPGVSGRFVEVLGK
ncbi:MAG: 50S ribosomal protein L3 [Candidatus Moranbacteria bacterium GW2011_GWE2_35_2-]|nr:MAG: 50S ribosomal protein L3 [Candidatus Moranbacteria bacterium GW2011_GWE2_35_2-]KKQ22931.1 MAG: 50S ribosomal protein L3 [Candidatus Moranbacteria bacterium GW2011_GWF2_37_11]KKQ29289.1 MAG: 50S ribosomal protein L3 [Candidatus Moranbacteria bacterium GW2011_GWD1_37_17]KKQ30838.1 MAG: 50S ribosomal protein L3 [Candidatus Moranbacteria bacterium GW2011_GWE1_37_24]KKQ47959.1 MAG: 50S ribosomal protein L3 [Candidatus Moranbacteria bacterium GW2011_GWD2_37_9]HBO16966.1 50S ribosomal protein